MKDSDLSIHQLASAAGLTRRAIRFYVQRGLLPPPNSMGRGRHYDARHLARIRQIQSLQARGHSLDAIQRIVAGDAEPGEAVIDAELQPHRPPLAAQLWTRLPLGDGVELHFDTRKLNPEPETLAAIKEAVARILKLPQ